MDLQLKGKRVLVTGSNSGIGAGTVKRMAEEGCIVVVHGRNAERASKVAAEISKSGGKAYVAVGDISNDEGAAAVVKAVRDQMGEVDILVNNAGGSDDLSLSWSNTTPQTWIDAYQKNTIAPLRMIQAFLPDMRHSGWGRIIQVASTQATMPYAHTSPEYNSAKAGVITLTVSLAKTLARTGITVNTVTPGPIDSPMEREFILGLRPFKDMTFEEAEPLAAKKWNVSAGRLGRPDDLATAITFLCSPLAGFITGHNLRVDGGMSGFINA